MYIYELPFDINRELCRLLDIDDYWKELAGDQMKYSPFDINEIEQVARRQSNSPTHQLFVRWGQLNHRVEELYILLYHMKHVPALRCLSPLVDARFHRLLAKLDSKNGLKKEKVSDDKGNKPTRPADGTNTIPLPVMLVQQGVSLKGSSDSTRRSAEPSSDLSSDTSNTGECVAERSVRAEIRREVASIPKISYEELRAATGGWSAANLLGRGGFGQVFKGEWKHLAVAVKRLKGVEGLELVREMSVNQYRHDNILPLYGYSIGGPEACLVYQKMWGSLDARLRCRACLSWPQRYRVAHGVARGLQYLHTLKPKTPLIHGDIKPANILLDACGEPKIADFGLARKGALNRDFMVSKIIGTRPYLPDEYLRHRILSPAVDVYSFGVVLLEMCTGLPPRDAARADPLPRLVRDVADPASLEDPALGGAGSRPALCRELALLALRCTEDERARRPDMEHVYTTIHHMHFQGKILL